MEIPEISIDNDALSTPTIAEDSIAAPDEKHELEDALTEGNEENVDTSVNYPPGFTFKARPSI